MGAAVTGIQDFQSQRKVRGGGSGHRDPGLPEPKKGQRWGQGSQGSMASRAKERSEVEAGVTGIHDFQSQRKVRGGGRGHRDP